MHSLRSCTSIGAHFQLRLAEKKTQKKYKKTLNHTKTHRATVTGCHSGGAILPILKPILKPTPHHHLLNSYLPLWLFPHPHVSH